ncbi:MAG: hypothetical protein ACK528_05560 [Alphaproteobacteria bacterium]
MTKKLRIVIVEDDPRQAQWLIEEVILRGFPDAEIKYYGSESSFLADAESSLKEWQPGYALLDLMVRFYSIIELAQCRQPLTFETLPKPEESGLRCCTRMRDIAPQCRVAIATVLDFHSSDTTVLRKGSDSFSSSVVAFLSEP